MLSTKEHQDLMEAFERDYNLTRKHREDRSVWSENAFYCDGRINEQFLAFRKGYAFGKFVGQNDG